MIIWGINNLNHDASISVFNNDLHLFSSHSERYSRIKNDYILCNDILDKALTYGKPELLLVSENNIKKKARQLLTLDKRFFDSHKQFLREKNINSKIKFYDHHESHAAGAAYTSKFEKSLVFVFDSIGEFTTTSTWLFENNNLTPIHKINYPSSLGLFYSAFTKLLGFKPNEEEFILMGMASHGEPKYFNDLLNMFDLNIPNFKLKKNLHKGVQFHFNSKFDLASSVQAVYEYITTQYVLYFKNKFDIDNACFSGGCALNCKANSNYLYCFKNVWVYPNSGDAGNSLGVILNHTKSRFLYSAFLGENIESNIDPEQVVDEILKNKVIGLAHGKAEYGPRALGNRSILADPRESNTKLVLNRIKNREPFRPFAPAVLNSEFTKCFSSNINESKYMTFTFLNKTNITSIQNNDKTSRVQTVNSTDNTLLYSILNIFYSKTGIPFLINTSLNTKGNPLMNKKYDSEFDFKVF